MLLKRRMNLPASLNLLLRFALTESSLWKKIPTNWWFTIFLLDWMQASKSSVDAAELRFYVHDSFGCRRVTNRVSCTRERFEIRKQRYCIPWMLSVHRVFYRQPVQDVQIIFSNHHVLRSPTAGPSNCDGFSSWQPCVGWQDHSGAVNTLLLKSQGIVCLTGK